MSIKNSAGDQVRLNVKNDQTYTLTVALPFASLGTAVMQGYTTNPGDLGRAIFTSNLVSATQFTVAANTNVQFLDLIFDSTGASSTQLLFSNSSNLHVVFIRCVFRGSRSSGLVNQASALMTAIECEAYDCNKGNVATAAGFQTSGTNGSLFCYNCYSHDHAAGTNAHGYSSAAASSLILVNCIADTCAGSGVNLSSTGNLTSIGSNYYNNSVDGIKIAMSGAATWCTLINNNFLKNTGAGVNCTTTGQGGILYNNGRGAGSQANGSADTLQCIVDTSTDITYASGDTPWIAPTTGNFTTIPTSPARSAGRGAFTEIDGTNTGTVAYPDIGAAQALVTPELRIPSIASI